MFTNNLDVERKDSAFPTPIFVELSVGINDQRNFFCNYIDFDTRATVELY